MSARADDPVEQHQAIPADRARSTSSETTLVDVAVGGVDHHRVVGRAQRRRDAPAVDRVPARQRGLARRRPRRRAADAASSRWRRRARSSSLAVRNTFNRRGGEHDGADVATFHHAAAVLAQPTPAVARTSTDRTPGCADDGRHGRSHLRAADLGAHVATVDRRHAALDRDRAPGRERAHRPARRRASTPRSRAASVTARYIAPVSSTWSPSAHATPRAIVDFPDPDGPSIATTRLVATAHRAPVRRARSSANSGYDDDTACQPRTVLSPSIALAAIAAAIAMRWSP